MLTEEDKTEMYLEYKKIVYQVANRYRYLDQDFEDVLGWGMVGFSKAMDDYDRMLSSTPERDSAKFESEQQNKGLFTAMIYTCVKTEILGHYRQRTSDKAFVSMDAPVSGSSLESESDLIDFLGSNAHLAYDERDMYHLLRKVLESFNYRDQNIIITHLMSDHSRGELAAVYKVSVPQITKLIRRGIAWVKKYFEEHHYFIEKVRSSPCSNKKSRSSLPDVESKDYGKIKYLRVRFTDLNINDIAAILHVSSNSVSQIQSLRTSTYTSAKYDDSIHDEASSYLKKHYPERIPGEVIMLQAKELELIV